MTLATTPCSSCAYWDAFPADGYGKCRCHAPVVLPGSSTARWPVTAATDWCGEWEATPAAKADPARHVGMI